MNPQIPGAIATAISLGGLTFYAGREANRVDELFMKAHAASLERASTKEVIFDIHGKVCKIEQDIEIIKEKNKNFSR